MTIREGVNNRGRSNVLSHNQRLEIISLFENEKVTKAQLGRMFGVTEGAIRKLIRKKDAILEKPMPTDNSTKTTYKTIFPDNHYDMS